MEWEWVGERENRRMDSVDFENDYIVVGWIHTPIGLERTRGRGRNSFLAVSAQCT